jgi:hypothetical protein
MTREEYNEQFLIEIAYQKETGEISDGLKNLFYLLIKNIINSERYKFLDEDMKYMCTVVAYEACVTHVRKFNPEKSENAYAYVATIIRSSISGTIAKLKKNQINLENYC